MWAKAWVGKKTGISDCLTDKARPLGMTRNSFLLQEWAHCWGKVHFIHLDAIWAMHEFLNSSCVYIQSTCRQENQLQSCHCVFFFSAAFISPLCWIFRRLKALTLRAPWLKGNDDRMHQCFIVCVTFDPRPHCLHVSQSFWTARHTHCAAAIFKVEVQEVKIKVFISVNCSILVRFLISIQAIKY